MVRGALLDDAEGTALLERARRCAEGDPVLKNQIGRRDIQDVARGGVQRGRAGDTGEVVVAAADGEDGVVSVHRQVVDAEELLRSTSVTREPVGVDFRCIAHHNVGAEVAILPVPQEEAGVDTGEVHGHVAVVHAERTGGPDFHDGVGVEVDGAGEVVRAAREVERIAVVHTEDIQRHAGAGYAAIEIDLPFLVVRVALEEGDRARAGELDVAGVNAVAAQCVEFGAAFGHDVVRQAVHADGEVRGIDDGAAGFQGDGLLLAPAERRGMRGRQDAAIHGRVTGECVKQRGCPVQVVPSSSRECEIAGAGQLAWIIDGKGAVLVAKSAASGTDHKLHLSTRDIEVIVAEHAEGAAVHVDIAIAGLCAKGGRMCCRGHNLKDAAVHVDGAGVGTVSAQHQFPAAGLGQGACSSADERCRDIEACPCGVDDQFICRSSAGNQAGAGDGPCGAAGMEQAA